MGFTSLSDVLWINIDMQNEIQKHIKKIDYNCHIPDLVKAFSYVDNGWLNFGL